MVERFGNLSKHDMVKTLFNHVRDISRSGKDPRVRFVDALQHARIPIVKIAVSNIPCDLSINSPRLFFSCVEFIEFRKLMKQAPLP